LLIARTGHPITFQALDSYLSCYSYSDQLSLGDQTEE